MICTCFSFSFILSNMIVCSIRSIPSYYVPHDLVPKMQKAREIFSDIDATCCNDDFDGPNRRDKGHIEMNIIPIKAGETIELKQSKIRGGVRFYLKPFHVSHCGHPALGFTIISKTTTTGLKAKYKDLSGKELGELARSGVSIKESTEVEKAEVCYTGDTALDGLMRADRHDTSASLENLYQGFTAPLILCELTFLDPKDREKAKERGHLNIKDIEPILNSHGWKPSCASNNDCNIVFYHVSSRHGPVERILEILIRELPSHVTEVGEVAVASFIPSGFNFEGVQPNGCISLREYNKLLKG